jgi:hypothetical protein
MNKNTKLTIGKLKDPMCPECNVPMFGVSAITFGTDKKFKHYAQCPECNYKTKEGALSMSTTAERLLDKELGGL